MYKNCYCLGKKKKRKEKSKKEKEKKTRQEKRKKYKNKVHFLVLLSFISLIWRVILITTKMRTKNEDEREKLEKVKPETSPIS